MKVTLARLCPFWSCEAFSFAPRAGCGFVAGLIGCGNTALRRVNLSANGITDAGFTLLEDAVRGNEQVVELELRDNAAISEAMRSSMSDLMKIRFKP